MEIVVQSKNFMFQQKFHKKLYQSNRNSQLRSVMQEMIQLEFRSRSRTKYLALTPSEKLNTLERKC